MSVTSYPHRNDARSCAYDRRRSYRIRNRTFLRLKRESRNLSQAEMAAFIGVSRSAVTHWESGVNPCVEIDHAELIATLLDEPMKALFVE